MMTHNVVAWAMLVGLAAIFVATAVRAYFQKQRVLLVVSLVAGAWMLLTILDKVLRLVGE